MTHKTKPDATSSDRGGLWARIAQRAGIEPAPEIAPAAPAAYTAPSRQGRKPVTIWQDPAAVKQLKLLAAETGISQQKLAAEALNLLFVKHGKPPIAN